MSELAGYATYRHDVTGLVGVYPVRLGDNDAHLTRVKHGAKPLALVPIPREVVDAARAKSKAKSGDAPRGQATSDNDEAREDSK